MDVNRNPPFEGPTNDRRGERPLLQPNEWYVTNKPTRYRYREEGGPDYNRWPDQQPQGKTWT